MRRKVAQHKLHRRIRAMAANFEWNTAHGTFEAIERDFNNLVKEEGGPQSGEADWGAFPLGLINANQLLEDETAARNYLQENAERWGSAMAVQYGDENTWLYGGWATG